jgi:hypothetical protein
MAERRKSQRSRSLRAGKILFNGKRSVITCTLRNQSGEGASLQVQRHSRVLRAAARWRGGGASLQRGLESAEPHRHRVRRR